MKLKFYFGDFDDRAIPFLQENMVLPLQGYEYVLTGSDNADPFFEITTPNEKFTGYFEGFSVVHQELYSVNPIKMEFNGNAVLVSDKGNRLDAQLQVWWQVNESWFQAPYGFKEISSNTIEGQYPVYWIYGLGIYTKAPASQINYESRISVLENWMNQAETQLNAVTSWLFFWRYNATGKSVCDAVASECKASVIKCKANSGCGTDGYVGNPSCSGNNVFQSYVAYKCNNPGLSTASCSNTTTSQLKTACPKKCLNGACVDCLTAADCSAGQSCVSNVCQGTTPPPSGVCSFRTNAVSGNYGSGTWIAVDVNGDGKLEGFGYYGSSGGLAACGGPTIAKTPQGYNVAVVSGRPQVCVPIAGGKVVQKNYYTASAAAVTSTSPTPPFIGNNQEVCS
jgi:hypothetical protein